MIVNVEGMDAAGKGGANRRLVERRDPRSFKVYRVGAPDERDQARHISAQSPTLVHRAFPNADNM